MVQYVTLARTDATAMQTATVQIRRLALAYYGSNDASGLPNDLMTVALQALVGTRWVTISTTASHIQNPQ